MKIYSWYNRPKKRYERSDSKSLVPNVPVLSATQRITQALLTGVLTDANRYGYDYTADQELPEEIKVADLRHLNVLERMEYAKAINERLRLWKQIETEDHPNANQPLQHTGQNTPTQAGDSDSSEQANIRGEQQGGDRATNQN